MLKYSEGAVVLGFSADAESKIDMVNAMANNCRWWYEPIFADDQRFLPVRNSASAKPSEPTVSTALMKSAPKPPQKAQDNTLIHALLVGAGFFVLYKIIS